MRLAPTSAWPAPNIVWVGSWEIGRALQRILTSMPAGSSEPSTAWMSAACPDRKGAAMEVPLQYAYLLTG